MKSSLTEMIMNGGKRMIALPENWSDWEITGELGRGSFSVVYEAARKEDPSVRCAIKLITIPQDESEYDELVADGFSTVHSRSFFAEAVNDFTREIKLMEHFKGMQNIVSIEDYKVIPKEDSIGSYIFIRMELLTSLEKYISDKTLSEEEIIQIGVDICTALEFCQERSIIHRDIKPANIFVNDKLGTHVFYKLGDFGIARNLEGQTQGLSSKGTPNYMAPEVASNQPYDGRADIYSLGLTLYWLLNANRLPFFPQTQLYSPASKADALRRRLAGEEIEPPVNASPTLSDVILRAIRFDPADRYPTASEMKKALRSLLKQEDLPAHTSEENPAHDPEPETVPVPLKRRSVRKLLWIPAVLAAALALFFFAATIWNRQQASVTCPYTLHLSSREGIKLLEAGGLGVEMVYVTSDEYPADFIIQQVPAPGTVVRKGDTVILTVSSGPAEEDLPDTVTMPDLGAADYESAVGLLKSIGIGSITIERVVSSKPSGTVISQKPGPGTEVSPDSDVCLTVSGGMVLVPDLVNMSLENAETMLEQASLAVDANIAYLSPSLPEDHGKVAAQSPEAGQSVMNNTPVSLVILHCSGIRADIELSLPESDGDLNLVILVHAEHSSVKYKVYSAIIAPDFPRHQVYTIELPDNRTYIYTVLLDGNTYSVGYPVTAAPDPASEETPVPEETVTPEASALPEDLPAETSRPEVPEDDRPEWLKSDYTPSPSADPSEEPIPDWLEPDSASSPSESQAEEDKPDWLN